VKTGRFLALALTLGTATGALAADRPPQFWNLISTTVTKLELSKAGANALIECLLFGSSLCEDGPVAEVVGIGLA
jgi:hypothetical protein